MILPINLNAAAQINQTSPRYKDETIEHWLELCVVYYWELFFVTLSSANIRNAPHSLLCRYATFKGE